MVCLVNTSNTSNIELDLLPPVKHNNELINTGAKSFVLPIMYPFGTIHIVLFYFAGLKFIYKRGFSMLPGVFQAQKRRNNLFPL